VGGPVVSLTNSFNYSLNKKRFNMMKNIISSPYRKMKVLLILPVFAVVLYSFAKPDYRYKGPDEMSGNLITSVQQIQNEVKGIIVMSDGSALPGANITIQNTTIGTITDDNGAFKIVNVPDNDALVVSFVGFKSKEVKPDFKSVMQIEMVKDTLKLSNMNISTPPPPPPPSKGGAWGVGQNGQVPLYVVDGKIISEEDLKKIDPASIESISVLKESSDKYGSKGKNGVVEVTLIKGNKGDSKQLPVVAPPPPPPPPVSDSKDLDSQAAPVKDTFVVMEELPEFFGGKTAMAVWINSNLKYPVEAFKNKISGEVQVSFTVTASGKIKNAVVSKPVSPLLDAEAVRVISSMPDWKPGTQGGKSVSVQMLVPVEFKIN
jgi:TonB family protein